MITIFFQFVRFFWQKTDFARHKFYTYLSIQPLNNLEVFVLWLIALLIGGAISFQIADLVNQQILTRFEVQKRGSDGAQFLASGFAPESGTRVVHASLTESFYAVSLYFINKGHKMIKKSKSPKNVFLAAV